MRIVSLVPSTTASLCEVGLERYIVGCTNFCVEPSHLAKSCTLIGGTKDPSIDLIHQLNPSHIFANKEENRREDVEALAEKFAVNVTHPQSPEDVPKVLGSWRDFLGLEGLFSDEITTIHKLLTELKEKTLGRKKSSFIYLIWKDPYMAVGGDTYISRLLESMGLENKISHLDRYPPLELADIQSLNPDYIFMGTEPYPFRKRDLKDFSEFVGPVFIKVDGRLASWHGLHLIDAIKIYLDKGLKESAMFKSFN